MQVNKSVGYDLINSYLRLCRSISQFVVTSCALTLVETVKLCCFSVNHDTCITTEGNTPPYVLVTATNKNWADAQRYCRMNHTDLASVRNQTENEKIKTFLESVTEAWIGLFRDAWEWSDNSTSSFRHWKTGEPNYGDSVDGFCAQITSSGHWNDVPCHNPSNFICYEGKSPGRSFLLLDGNSVTNSVITIRCDGDLKMVEWA